MKIFSGQMSLSLDLPQPASKFPIQIEGKARVFTCFLPIDEIDTVEASKRLASRQVFIYAWTDKQNGASAHVTDPFNENGGRFALNMEIGDGGSPALKLHASVRMQDQETKNFRTFPLAVSCSDLESLLQGTEDSFSMEDQFMEGNFVNVSLRVVNADQYRNHLSCMTDGKKPFISFGETALDKIGQCNEIMKRISEDFQKNIAANHMTDAPGFESFKAGLTRSVSTPDFPKPMLFFSLLLGAPAYIFLMQSGVRRAEILDGGPGGGQCRAVSEGEDSQHSGRKQYQTGYPHASVPLRGNACPGRVAFTGDSRCVGNVPHSSQAGPFWRDGGECAQVGRCSLWDALRAGPAAYMRPWTNTISKRWDPAHCLSYQGNSCLAPTGGSWFAS